MEEKVCKHCAESAEHPRTKKRSEKEYRDLMNRLKKQMGMTGAASVADIDPSVLWMP